MGTEKALLALVAVPVMMTLVYVLARYVRPNAWFGVVAAFGVIAVVALIDKGTAWWQVLLIAAGIGLVAGVLALPFLLLADLRRAVQTLADARREEADGDGD